MSLYKQYDQTALDSQFNNRLHVPDYADYLNRWALQSRETERLPVEIDIAYGSLQREKLDVYPSPHTQSKTLIFIHGGYWQMLDKSMFRFIANGFHSYPVTTVLLTYPLAPEVSIGQIVSSCRKAIHWLYLNLSGFNGDPANMYVIGHSAGGHLAAMLMATDWKQLDERLPANLIKGACTLSGLFNLVPVQRSYLNKVLQMDQEIAIANSPVTLEPLNRCPLIVAVGEAETAEFNAQSKELYSSWKDKGIQIELLKLPKQNHYSIVETIVDQQSSLHKAFCNMMEIEKKNS